MSKVFISYARKNQLAAEVLYSVVTEWGHDVWMDVHRLEPGRSWVNGIDNALRESEIVIGLLTPEGLDSPNVMAEWFWALENDRKLILMRVADFSREKVSHKLIHLQWIDYYKDEGGGFGRLRSVMESGTPLAEAASGSMASTDAKPISRIRWLSAKAPGNSNRELMLQRVHAYWIEGVLHQAVKEANQFNVGYELAPDAVLKHIDYSDCLLPANTDFGRVFKHLGAEVLILGTPGSGKTILLLQLAEQLLANAASDRQAPIPIVLNLSGWSHKREPLDDWIVNEAAMSYQVPRKAIRLWMAEEAIIPLLDGLDEVLPEYREACVDAINHFHCRYRSVGLGVCSRIGDYELLQSKIDFRSAILIQALDECQVHAVTSRADLASLRVIFEQEPALVEMSHTPYLLNVMSYAYAGKTEAELRLPNDESTEEARRMHMLDTYINRRLAETRELRVMSAQRMRSLLAWLAFNMTERGLTVFHIESLQMDWLTKFRDRWLYCFLSRVLFGFAGMGAVGIFGWVIGLAATCIVLWVSQRSMALLSGWMTTLTYVTGSFLIIFLVLFFLAGVCSASLERVRSLPTKSKVFKLVSLGVFGPKIGLLAGLLMVVAFVASHLCPTKDTMSTLLVSWMICTGTSITCMGSALISSKLGVRSTVPSYMVSGFFVGLWVAIFAITKGSYLPLSSAVLASGFLIFIFTVTISALALFGDQIQTAERIAWRWNWKATAGSFGLWWVFIFGMLTLGFLVNRLEQKPYQFPIKPEPWLVIFGIACGLGAIGGIVYGFQRAETIHRRLLPNEGVLRSVRMGISLAIWFAVMGFLLIEVTHWLILHYEIFGKRHHDILSDLIQGIPISLNLSAFPAAIGAMLGGFDVPVKHLVLRGLLTLGAKIPLRLRRFLDACASQLMLRRVGGGYLFVHRYLLEHFARIHRETTLSAARKH